MKVAVLGGAGKVSLGAIQDFVEQDSVKEILLADINVDALEHRKNALACEKVVTKVVDLNNHESLVKTLNKYDVCLNGSSHHFNLKVMKACLEARTHYTDFGGLFHWAREQLKLHADFEQAGITAIVGSGSAPGIVNVMARYAYDRLDSVKSVKIRDGIVNFNQHKDRFVPPYAIETLLDEFIMNPYEFKDGKFVEVEPFSGEEFIDFPHPIGRQKVMNTIHSEVATIPLSFPGIEEVTFKLALPKLFEEQLRFLVKLGLGGKAAISVGEGEVVPRKVLARLVASNNKRDGQSNQTHDDHKALRVEVAGEKDGKQCQYTLDTVISPYRKWPHLSQGVFSVGFPAAVTARMLGSGSISKPGVFPSEAGIDPVRYFTELATREIIVKANFSYEI